MTTSITGNGSTETTKYNVDRDIEKRTYGGITFDSVLEMRFYRDVLCPQVESGEIIEYELQKPYELQPGFNHDGKSVRSITYIADFYMKYKDGHEVVIDTKGMPTQAALIKRKMFWYRYPDVDYRWLTYVKKYGGWIDYNEYKKLKRTDKNKDLKEKNNGK